MSGSHPTSNSSPIFVVGCPRSGTTFLYHILVSSGGFADYRAETHLYDRLVPRFRPFESRNKLERFLDAWLESRSFARTGLDRNTVRTAAIDSCASAGELLSLIGTSMAAAQGRPRWAECTPFHLHYMRQIKREIPTAKFLHVIRDGRDVAVSLEKLGWVRPLPWDRGSEVVVAAWIWEWFIERGRHFGQAFSDDYREVRFETLAREPEVVLEEIGSFIGHNLDYPTILRNVVGSVAKPNTAFAEDESDNEITFDPVGRWRDSFRPEEVRSVNNTVGSTLASLGYSVDCLGSGRNIGLAIRKLLYLFYREVRLWLKDHTRLSRLFTRTNLDRV